MALSSMSKNPIDNYLPNGLSSMLGANGTQGPGMPVPPPDYSKLSPEQEKVANAVAWGIRNAVKNDSPYKLSKIAQAEGLAPNLTCIGGACNLYKNLGLDFSVFGKEPGVRESDEGGTIVEYNPTFAKNYAKAGFIKLKDKEISNDELQEMLKAGLIKKGDIIQNVNETTGIPYHSNVVYDASGPNEEPRYTVYNAYKHSDALLNKKSGPNDHYLYNPVDVPEFKNRKYNIFRLSDEKAKELVKADVGGKLSQTALETSIDNEVGDIVKQITDIRDRGTSKNYLRETYGTSDLSRENIEKIAKAKYLSNLQYQTNPAVWIKANKNNKNFNMSNDFAQELANEAKRKLELYLKEEGYGVSPFTFQQTNRMKAALSN